MKSDLTDKSVENLQNRCLYCGRPADLVWVHGHGQCSNCGINVDECCRGESCGIESVKFNSGSISKVETD